MGKKLEENIEKILEENDFEGVVERPILGKKARVVGFIKNNEIYDAEDTNKMIGYVKDNSAHSSVLGGPRNLGRVRYTGEEKDYLI